jgi:hypothetical protein
MTSATERLVGGIRAAAEDDIPQIAELRSRVFSWRLGDPASLREAAVQRIFFRSPFHDPALPSLVYVNDRGAIVGFLGVSGRTFLWQGAPLRVAVPTGFMVEPAARGMAGVMLLRRLLDGAQDLTVADSPNPSARRLMESLGGVTALHHSLFWVRPLRPVRHAVGQIRDGGLLFSARLLARPVATALDALATRAPGSPFHVKDPGSREEPLTARDLARLLVEVQRGCTPSPSYDEAALGWLLDALDHGPRADRFQRVLVRSRENDVIGWYLRFTSPLGASDVVQMGARRERYGELLDHLFYAAWRDGSVAVSGRVQPAFLETLSDKACVFSRTGPPVLVYSRHPELLQAVRDGRGFLSQLEGEWWMIHLSEA